MRTQTLTIGLVALATAATAQATPLTPGPDGLIVDLADDMSASDIEELEQETGLDLVPLASVETGNRYVLRGNKSLLERAKRLLSGDDDVESVELNAMYSIHDTADMSAPVIADEDMKPSGPNDPMYKSQWHFNMVNAEGAWPRAKGEGIVVAVLDTGVSPGKINGKKSRFKRVPDLKDSEFVGGYNFVDNNEDPSDGNAHGTHVAGTIAQSTNNGYGVAGLAYKAKIMPVKVLSDRGFGSVAAIASGIRWAADNGANVINMSLGGGMYSSTLARAVKYAHDKGVFVACAAGNGGRQKVEYPAAYKGAFAVSALDPKGELAFYSSYGKELAIAAPGGDTRVDLNKDGLPDGVLQDTIARGDPNSHGFFPFQGTSMATPHVAAAAALVMSTGITDPDRVAKVLKESAKDLKDPIRFGAGGLDAAAAVKKSQRESGGLGFALALLLGTMVLRRERRRDAHMTLRMSPVAVGSMAVASGGLFFLHEFMSGAMVSVFASPLLEWPAYILGAEWHLLAIVGSVAIPLVAVFFLYGVKSVKPALYGLCIGVGAYLLINALLGEVNVRGVPGHGLLDAAWLTLNGIAAVALGGLVARRR